MTSILITGCNRGLGLGLVKELTKLPKPPKIFATCRDVGKAEELNQIANKNKNVNVLQVDLKNFNEYPSLIKKIEEMVKGDGLNVLFNNAGIGPKTTQINALNEQEFIDAFLIHAIVPVMLSKACIPLLEIASKRNENKRLGVNRAAIVNMSAMIASIELNKKEGNMYAYRASKSALNAISRSLSVDLKKLSIICVAVHPGWVKTDMGGPKAPLDIETSCSSLIKTMLAFNEDHNGGFYQYDDLTNFDQYERLVKEVDDVVKDNGLNVLFNNAGVAPKSTRILMTKERDLVDSFTCNAVVPIMLTKAFLPLLKKAADVNNSKPLSIERSAIINMSSILGSIEGNTDGGMYAYRASKAALNAATKSLSIDLKSNKILCVALHPGWVKTDMGGSKAPLDVETSCSSIIKTVLNFKEKHNGGFFQYDGEKLPW